MHKAKGINRIGWCASTAHVSGKRKRRRSQNEVEGQAASTSVSAKKQSGNVM